MNCSIRPLELTDITRVVDYFHAMSDRQLRNMGVDPKKLPSVDQWTSLLEEDFARPLEEKQFYYLIWQVDGQVVGHSNLNKIVHGDHAYMHLHLWHAPRRQMGIGTALIRQSIEHYFRTLQLKSLLCEPFADNLAPNKTLAKVGFRHVRTYETVPGWINYRQTVNRWQLDRGDLLSSKD